MQIKDDPKTALDGSISNPEADPRSCPLRTNPCSFVMASSELRFLAINSHGYSGNAPSDAELRRHAQHVLCSTFIGPDISAEPKFEVTRDPCNSLDSLGTMSALIPGSQLRANDELKDGSCRSSRLDPMKDNTDKRDPGSPPSAGCGVEIAPRGLSAIDMSQLYFSDILSTLRDGLKPC